MKIVIDSDIPFIRGVLEPFATVSYIKGERISQTDARDADALIIRTRTRCDANLLAGSRVRIIATATIGYDHIDMDYCAAHGIKVVTAAGSNARGVLQWLGAALTYASGRDGWNPRDKTLGVVGVGHVGSLAALYAAQWGFSVVCCDPPRKRSGEKAPDGQNFVSLSELTSRCDIITFHTPLTREGEDRTYHLASEQFFSTVKNGTLVLNSSRGEVVDTQALNNAITLKGCSACIDTWEGEPHLDPALLADAIVATPHIAGYSAQGKANATALAVKAVASEFCFGIDEWYPYGDVPRIVPKNISWDELKATIGAYFDIGKETATLKGNPQDFETLRNNYKYRTEYF